MRKIEKLPPARPPHRCAIYTQRTEDDEGFIDTRSVLPGWDRHIFLSVTGVKEAAKLCGMVPKEELEAAQAQAARLRDEIEKAVARLEVIERHQRDERAIGSWSEPDADSELERAAELEAAEVG